MLSAMACVCRVDVPDAIRKRSENEQTPSRSRATRFRAFLSKAASIARSNSAVVDLSVSLSFRNKVRGF